MILLGMDMGKMTSCVSIVEITKPLLGNKKTIKVIKNEMVPPSLMGLTEEDYSTNAIKHVIYFRALLDEHNPDKVSVESFFSRNHRTNLGGIISTLIALMWYECLIRDIPFRAFAPNTWKRALKRVVCEADRFYDMSRPVKNRTPPHAYDSLFLALYGHPRKFSCVTPRQLNLLTEELKNVFTSHLSLSEEDVKKKKKKRRKKKSPRLSKAKIQDMSGSVIAVR